MKKMKKTLLTMLAVAFAATVTFSQTVEEGIKKIYYLRIREAVEVLEKAVAAKPNDPLAIYWLGQAYLKAYTIADSKDALGKAKDTYQKALNSGVNDPWIWVGMGHVELLEGNNASARQRFEQAITATTQTKGKNKGKEDPAILNAIGAANADGGSTKGDPVYAVEKLKRAAELDLVNPDIDINLGVAYLKLGSDKGGEAVEAFMDAIRRNPQYAAAYARIGRIYRSQNNTEYMNEWYGKAIAADPAYGPVYLDYFNYYKDRDVNIAKEYLDKFMANSEKDCATDFFLADYLYRAGKNQESMAKVKEMESSACKDYIRIKVLYAYNYDKMGDSLKAKSYMKEFFDQAPPEKIEPSDYVFAGKLVAKFAGSEDEAVKYLERAIDLDTSGIDKIQFLGIEAAVLGRAKRFDEQSDVFIRIAKLKGKVGAPDYYYMTKAAIDAKNCTKADSLAKAYLAAFPDQQQAFGFTVTAAKMCDIDTTKGLAVDPINAYNTFLSKDTEKNRKTIFNNDYYLLIFYAQYAKDLQKAIDVCDAMIALYPDPASEENKFATTTKDQLSKAQQKKSGTGAAPAKTSTNPGKSNQ